MKKELGVHFVGNTLTLGLDAENKKMGKYLNRYWTSLRKIEYDDLEYIWTKEFTKRGMLHEHVLQTRYIEKNVSDYYWELATDKTSYITWPKDAEIRSTAAYMSKYMTKSIYGDHRFAKGENRYGMSSGFRKYWNIVGRAMKESWEHEDCIFVYDPDDSKIKAQYAEKANEMLAKIKRHRAEQEQGN